MKPFKNNDINRDEETISIATKTRNSNLVDTLPNPQTVALVTRKAASSVAYRVKRRRDELDQGWVQLSQDDSPLGKSEDIQGVS